MEMNTTDKLLNKYVFGNWIVLCLFLVNATGEMVTPVSATFRRSIFSEPTKAIPGPEKNYTGIRVKNDSLLLLYYHGQTLAIVETDPSRTLYNCELLEVKTKVDKQVALNNLKPVVPIQMKIGFTDMLELMSQCNKLNTPWNFGKTTLNGHTGKKSFRTGRQFISIFSGLFPGTKWCGAGDNAASYHDLGSEKEMDKCCRNHDLCPIKVAGLRTQYNLTNYAFYTRSHCLCDDYFYDCLKAVDTSTSTTLGRIYFNVTPVVCVEDVLVEDGSTDKTKKQFTTKKKPF